MILYVAADLLWSSRIKTTGDKLGTPCRPVRSLEMLDARLAEGPVSGVLLDLDAPELAFAVLGRLRGPKATERELAIRTIAWGPHVAVDLLSEARQKGCDQVMTRGQFANELPEILQQLNAT